MTAASFITAEAYRNGGVSKRRSVQGSNSDVITLETKNQVHKQSEHYCLSKDLDSMILLWQSARCAKILCRQQIMSLHELPKNGMVCFCPISGFKVRQYNTLSKNGSVWIAQVEDGRG
ncbi:unnamed protein product [Cylicocyclus nassatus]|uniref:Uncharacterized protein n=1 Tax=Cylicocyclus nassatus TaxID=53992 RepID=A0AA36GWD0_CYLNA|nr:unnamed protein product [Cylicocyclus nassatus]